MVSRGVVDVFAGSGGVADLGDGTDRNILAGRGVVADLDGGTGRDGVADRNIPAGRGVFAGSGGVADLGDGTDRSVVAVGFIDYLQRGNLVLQGREETRNDAGLLDGWCSRSRRLVGAVERGGGRCLGRCRVGW
jgi:hypothetical protein